jgi:hypothetical protein
MLLPRPESGVNDLSNCTGKHQNPIQLMGMHMTERELPLALSAARFDTVAANLRPVVIRAPPTY